MMPVVLPAVATKVLLLPQAPPGVPSLSVVLDKAQMSSVPVMAPGDGLTVTLAVALQPVE
jgi:hypothetical protein